MNERSFIVKSRIVPGAGELPALPAFSVRRRGGGALLTQSEGGIHNLVFLRLTRPPTSNLPGGRVELPTKGL